MKPKNVPGIGHKNYHLEIISLPVSKNGRRYVQVRCNCGNEFEADVYNLHKRKACESYECQQQFKRWPNKYIVEVGKPIGIYTRLVDEPFFIDGDNNRFCNVECKHGNIQRVRIDKVFKNKYCSCVNYLKTHGRAAIPLLAYTEL